MKLAINPEEIAYPSGLEIAVKGYKAESTDASEMPAQIYVEVYEGKLQVHVWRGEEGPVSPTEIDPIEQAEAAS